MVLGPQNFGMDNMVGMGDLGGISVGVKIPKSVTDVLKLVPEIKKEAPAYAKALQAEAANTRSAVSSVGVIAETGVVALVFGGIIAALLFREKGK